MKNNLNISIVVPCYNEAKRIEKGLIDTMLEYVKKDPRIKEIIIVDDGSADDSREIIKSKYLKTNPNLTLIEAPHQGKAFTLITGIKSATQQYVLLSDIDLATPLTELDKLTAAVDEGYKIAIGSRHTRREGAPLLRKLMSSGYMFLRSFFINLQGVTDTQCGFKLYDRQAALSVIDQLRVFKRKKLTTGRVVAASFDLEFLFVCTKLGFKIKEVPVAWKHVDTENVGDYVRDGVRTMKDILLIKYYDITGKYNQT